MRFKGRGTQGRSGWEMRWECDPYVAKPKKKRVRGESREWVTFAEWQGEWVKTGARGTKKKWVGNRMGE